MTAKKSVCANRCGNLQKLPKSRKARILLLVNLAAAVVVAVLLVLLVNNGWDTAVSDRDRRCGALLLALIGAVPLAFGRYLYTGVTLAALGIGVAETNAFLAVASPYAEAVRETQMIVICAVTLGAALGAAAEVLSVLWRKRRDGLRAALGAIFTDRFVQAGLAFLAMLIAMNAPLYETGYWQGERVLALCVSAAVPFLLRFYVTAAAYLITYVLANQGGNLVSFLGGGLGPQAGPYGMHNGAMVHAMITLIAVCIGVAVDAAILVYRKRKQQK